MAMRVRKWPRIQLMVSCQFFFHWLKHWKFPHLSLPNSKGSRGNAASFAVCISLAMRRGLPNFWCLAWSSVIGSSRPSRSALRLSFCASSAWRPTTTASADFFVEFLYRYSKMDLPFQRNLLIIRNNKSLAWNMLYHCRRIDKCKQAANVPE